MGNSANSGDLRMSGIDAKQLRDYIVDPVLHYLDPVIPYSIAAVALLLGTAAQESGLRYLHQLGNGPACGLWQMEPHTHTDIWQTWLSKHEDVRDRLMAAEWFPSAVVTEDSLIGNLCYACAMTRIYYRRIKEPLPAHDDLYALGNYWKRYYNTEFGAGTVAEFIDHWHMIDGAIGHG